ncbi:DUF402 domain-containing protein [Paenibacillus sp. J2TS4]|uniref:DUF402 domain-containing protein n=1 Tax=Paenibacillus sp. J2TS4 TaxID=2807194 RepID=UPI001B1EF9DC|nr:DUF402 domain-containing protein [Paenibacillus sp. J2TS4]GIP34739.1 UPF0374 protein [Paenibacillus sp. J2TS4]
MNKSQYVIRSIKHDGRLHRKWTTNWLLPNSCLPPDGMGEQTLVLINDRTKVIESDGSRWFTSIPGVAFFWPDRWYNIIALIGASGVSYYCNLASPPQGSGRHLTYIDYDLDVVVAENGTIRVEDEEEYERNKLRYRYPLSVQYNVDQGLRQLMDCISERRPPFQADLALYCYQMWKERKSEEHS